MKEKKKPPPRMYCDICELFDAHDTEDCPIQASDPDIFVPHDKKERKLPPPRKYCESCESKLNFPLKFQLEN